MHVVLWCLAALLALVLGFAAYVRLAPSDPARWHVDPVTVAKPGPEGNYLLRPGGDAESPVYQLTPEALMARIDQIAMETPRCARLSGSVEALHATYVCRSALWGFPDYVSVRAIPAQGGSQLAIFSRLRFGRGDMGVNRARVEAWLARLASDA
jgi:hypothetical protein